MNGRLALLLLAALAGPAGAADLEIKGVRPGMTEAELLVVHPGLGMCKGTCYYFGDSRTRLIDKSLMTFAGMVVKSWWFSMSKDGKVKSSYVTLPAHAGPVVVQAFTEKYGKATASETSDFVTGRGVAGQKITTTWIDGDTALSVAHPSGKIDEMKVEIFSLAERRTDAEAAKAKAKSDL